MNLNGMDQNGNNSDDMPLEPPVPLNSFATGIYGEPEVLPRVGNQYQIEIPAIISKSEYRSYRKNPLEGGNVGGLHDIVMGLPISIIWVNQEVNPIKGDKIEFSNDLKRSSKRSRRYEHNAESIDVASGSDHLETNELEEKTKKIRGFFVPGSYGDSWSHIEKASFILGLYIFKKDFVRVKKFVETKRMGDILLFYYGDFNRTAEYRRWSGCRKGRFRKCALGERLFSGIRQQVLISRLFQGLSVELQNALMQVSRTFNERKISLEDYIFSLKNMVGMNTFIDAVGIGRGKQDLTGPNIELSKSNQAMHNRTEFPIGKSCSSLSRSEIIEILTGDYRLSKARSYDLFWEAVWPILLEKGWDAVESSSNTYATTSKQSHAFFAPGVSKSSRRGLVKGVHYFDSATDILSRVASDPKILDLDEKVDEGKAETPVENNNDDLPERHRQCYLQPRTPCQSSDVSSFTFLDTSLTNGKNYRMEDLKELTSEDQTMLTSIIQSDESTSDELDYANPIPMEKETESIKNFQTESSDNGVESFEVQNQENKHNDRPIFDLNYPPSDCDDFDLNVPEPQNAPNELTEPMAVAEANYAQTSPGEQTEPMAVAEANYGEEEEEELVNLQSRRQGSRNRPLTTRALEAIAHGLLTVNSRKGRGGESSCQRSRSSQQE